MLSFTCSKFANKVVWVAKKNEWILSLSYKLQRSRMLFHKLEICSFSKKHYFSVSPFRAVKCIFTPPPLSHGLICKWQLFVQCSIMDWMELSQICCRRSWYRSGPFNIGYIGAWNGYLRVGPGRGKCYQDILQPGRKHNNMAGRSGIGVLITGFSRVGALKKHAPLVYSLETFPSYTS